MDPILPQNLIYSDGYGEAAVYDEVCALETRDTKTARPSFEKSGSRRSRARLLTPKVHPPTWSLCPSFPRSPPFCYPQPKP